MKKIQKKVHRLTTVVGRYADFSIYGAGTRETPSVTGDKLDVWYKIAVCKQAHVFEFYENEERSQHKTVRFYFSRSTAERGRKKKRISGAKNGRVTKSSKGVIIFPEGCKTRNLFFTKMYTRLFFFFF